MASLPDVLGISALAAELTGRTGDFGPQPFLILYKGIHAGITGQESSRGVWLVKGQNLEPQVLFLLTPWHEAHYGTIRKIQTLREESRERL